VLDDRWSQVHFFGDAVEIVVAVRKSCMNRIRAKFKADVMDVRVQSHDSQGLEERVS
jgi:hypothetical protein